MKPFTFLEQVKVIETEADLTKNPEYIMMENRVQNLEKILDDKINSLVDNSDVEGYLRTQGKIVQNFEKEMKKIIPEGYAVSA